ncbi:thiol peroxidase [Salidesulfovibrio onnuriiensis]|uniref:thiol peroxidase n=1 Tax=Salidesulfovibrio onnuriiensis TaxID=2583823 RepID=UPI0011C75DBB|nr:thiol peroxidase [Salidesulfovibrio onnuriiensis]
MNERSGIVTFQGSPLTLLGNEVRVGDTAPDFTAVDNDMNPVSLADFKGKKLILAAVPSLDTPVCDMETRRFNTEAASLGSDVKIVTLSMDLPFAQKRWCGAAGVDAVRTLSDHREASFGTAYGVLIKELRLLARAVFVVDPSGTVVHAEYVPDITREPEYEAVLNAVKSIG